MKHFTTTLIVLILVTNVVFAQSSNPNWVEATNKAAWGPRDSHGGLAFKDRLWILGGWQSSYQAPPRDVWSSKDGKVWNLVNKSAPWIHSDFAMSTVFKNKMWIMGGWYNGRLEGHSAGNDVWSSRDGVKWKLETKQASWTPRIAAAVVEFKGKMWLLGGTEDYYFGNKSSLKNDVWYSSDGKKWKLATASAGWSPRAYLQAAVLNGKIYVFGGGTYTPGYFAKNDVWSSKDGVHWTQLTEAAPWHSRLWFSSVVYRNRIWLLGGWSSDDPADPSKNWDDVWYTKDGKEWKQYTCDTVWKKKHAPATMVFQDKIWIAGGMNPPLTNDVWSLKLPKDW